MYQYILSCHSFMLCCVCVWQANSKNSSGCIRLDINLLKPSRVELLQAPAPLLSVPDSDASSPKWLEYVYRTAHPVLRWLPTKLAEWIGENLQEELGFPDKADKRAGPGTGWTPAELNRILQNHVVHGSLTTFGCVEWESELFRGTMRARCYPFDMPKQRFHSFNPKVSHTVSYLAHVSTYCYIPTMSKYIQVYTSTYWSYNIFGSRIPLWSSRHILTASRRTATVYPWMTVGMPVPSSSSLAICARHMVVCRKTLPTNTALMTFATHWYSSAHLRCLICLSKVPWKMLEWSSCTNHPLHPVCTWLLLRTWSAESP